MHLLPSQDVRATNTPPVLGARFPWFQMPHWRCGFLHSSTALMIHMPVRKNVTFADAECVSLLIVPLIVTVCWRQALAWCTQVVVARPVISGEVKPGFCTLLN